MFHYGVSVQCEWCKYQLWMMCFIMVSMFSVNDVSISYGQRKCSLWMMCFIMVSVFNVSDVSIVDDVFHYGVSVQCE